MEKSQPQYKEMSISDGLKRSIERRKKAEENRVKVFNEDLVLAEFGMMYGWDAMLAAASDEMETSTFLELLEAGRRVQQDREYEMGKMMLIANLAARSEKPDQSYNAMTKDKRKKMKADTYG